MKAQTPTQQQLQATVLTEERDFAALEEEWEDLYEHCPSATPFQSWAWLYSWWEYYGRATNCAKSRCATPEVF